MSIKHILFNPQMVRAILDGRKTQTRRVVKGIENLNVYHAEPAEDSYETLREWDFFYGWSENGALFDAIQSVKAPYAPGDILWVREKWSTHYDGFHDDLQFCYGADDIDLKSECLPGENNRWYPSIHMPKEAARIFLRAKNLRVERLQDITAADIRSEGLTSMCAFVGDMEIALPEWRNLWNSTIKKADLPLYGWDANPWVWVIEFEHCEKPEGWPTCR